ncbi:MAG TPA: PIN domain-containing protein [Thermoanaerobaculia bacterium]|nr:PIN domain-containing protein [Thermoanaerobaculia bacterium]
MLGVDTDVLVSWAMAGAPRHDRARRLLEAEVRERGGALAIVPQVLYEFLHVTTDPRRFEKPLPMRDGLSWVRTFWHAREVVRVLPAPDVLARTLELLDRLRLGRKRILDTALAVTLESAGVRRFATFNHQDFRPFPFLEIVDPDGVKDR